jgi:hypothetical protein
MHNSFPGRQKFIEEIVQLSLLTAQTNLTTTVICLINSPSKRQKFTENQPEGKAITL